MYAADQGNADGQCLYGECLRDGRGIRMDLGGAVHYFKLAADQGNADGQMPFTISDSQPKTAVPEVRRSLDGWQNTASVLLQI
jgi:TPR repeat protein